MFHDDALARHGQGERQVGLQVVDALAVRPHMDAARGPLRDGAGRRDRRMGQERPRVLAPRWCGRSCQACPPCAPRPATSRPALSSSQSARCSHRAAFDDPATSPRRAAGRSPSRPSLRLRQRRRRKQPSRTTATTPGSWPTLSSSVSNFAPGEGGRSTRPCSRPGSARSWMKRGRPNTLSGMSRRGRRRRPAALSRRIWGQRRHAPRDRAARRRRAPSSWCEGCRRRRWRRRRRAAIPPARRASGRRRRDRSNAPRRRHGAGPCPNRAPTGFPRSRLHRGWSRSMPLSGGRPRERRRARRRRSAGAR